MNKCKRAFQRIGVTAAIMVLLGCSTVPAAPATSAARATGGPPYQVGGDVKAPVVVQRVEPKQAPGIHETGTVLLRAMIGVDGVPRDIAILKTSSHELSQASVNALKQWRFRPGTLNGEPVDVVFHLTMTFH